MSGIIPPIFCVQILQTMHAIQKIVVLFFLIPETIQAPPMQRPVEASYIADGLHR